MTVMSVHERNKPHTSPLKDGSNTRTSIQTVPLHLCEICKDTFESEADLDEHTFLIHVKDKPYKCGMCIANFSEKHDMSNHITLVHQTKKPFMTCAKFVQLDSRKPTFINTLKLYIKEKGNHKCDFCSLSFFSQDTKVQAHIASVHGPSPYNCDITAAVVCLSVRHAQQSSLLPH